MMDIKVLVRGRRVVHPPQNKGCRGSSIATRDVQHEPFHGDQVVSLSPKPLVLTTMAVPYDELVSLSLTSTIQDFPIQLGDNQEGTIGLVVKVPLLVRSGWVVTWVLLYCGTISLASALNIEHHAMEMAADVYGRLHRVKAYAAGYSHLSNGFNF